MIEIHIVTLKLLPLILPVIKPAYSVYSYSKVILHKIVLFH